MYKCPVCGIKKTSIQSINEHIADGIKKFSARFVINSSITLVLRINICISIKVGTDFGVTNVIKSFF